MKKIDKMEMKSYRKKKLKVKVIPSSDNKISILEKIKAREQYSHWTDDVLKLNLPPIYARHIREIAKNVQRPLIWTPSESKVTKPVVTKYTKPLEMKPVTKFLKTLGTKSISFENYITISNLVKKDQKDFDLEKRLKTRFLIETYDTHQQGSLKPLNKPLSKIYLPYIRKSIPLNRDNLWTYDKRFPLQNYVYPFHFDKSKGLEYRFQGLILDTSLNRDKKRYFYSVDLGLKYKPVLSTKNVLLFSSLYKNNYTRLNYSRENMIYVLPTYLNEDTVGIKHYKGNKHNISGLPWYYDANYRLFNYRLNFTRKKKSTFFATDTFISYFNESGKFIDEQKKTPDSSIFWTLSGTSYSSFFVNSYNNTSRVYFTHKYFRYYFLATLRKTLWNNKLNFFLNSIIEMKTHLDFKCLIGNEIFNKYKYYNGIRRLNILIKTNLTKIKFNKSTLMDILFLCWNKSIKSYNWLINIILNLNSAKNFSNLLSTNIQENIIYKNRKVTKGLVTKYDYFIAPGERSPKYRRWFVESNTKVYWYFFPAFKQSNYEHPVNLIWRNKHIMYDITKKKTSAKMDQIILILIRKFYTYLLKRAFVNNGKKNINIQYWFSFFYKLIKFFYKSQKISSSYNNLLFKKKKTLYDIKYEKQQTVKKWNAVNQRFYIKLYNKKFERPKKYIPAFATFLNYNKLTKKSPPYEFSMEHKEKQTEEQKESITKSN